MIAKLKGKIDTVGEEECLLDVHGIVYLVSCGRKALDQMVSGDVIVLHIETFLRQDMLRLFGFLTEEERAWFVRLQSIQGVGAKSALSILDVLPPQDLIQASETEDVSSITQAHGIGKKIAQRIITELKGKAWPKTRNFSHFERTSSPAFKPDSPNAPLDSPDHTAYRLRQDAISALVHLGFPENHVRSVIASLQASKNPDTNQPEQHTVNTLIKAALKELSS